MRQPVVAHPDHPKARPAPIRMSAPASHDFIARFHKNDDGEHLWHGYPDECFAMTSFADSLVAKILYGGWGIQPPITVVRMAIVVDFVSTRQAQAEASLAHGWNGAWEFPMGVVNSVHSRAETKEQNARIARHLTFIGTAMTMQDFDRRVTRRLLDIHSCPDGRHCEVCQQREPRALADALQILADGLELSEIHLFAKWRPSPNLTALLKADGINLTCHRLSSIPKNDLEANRYYSLWDGTERQGHDFRNAVWAPAWRR